MLLQAGHCQVELYTLALGNTVPQDAQHALDYCVWGLHNLG